MRIRVDVWTRPYAATPCGFCDWIHGFRVDNEPTDSSKKVWVLKLSGFVWM